MPVGNSMSARDLKTFRAALLTWYGKHRRDLPWRRTGDPYRIWLSEIMLQQTRVAAVIEYYERFLKRFPTVERLAAAREASVLAQWSGLGYYRRARNLHAAAKVVARRRAGAFARASFPRTSSSRTASPQTASPRASIPQALSPRTLFPRTAAELRDLPGIGRYTAGAIASIAFGEPVAVVDGNVERVISRLRGGAVIGERTWAIAEELLSREQPGDFNQAMMELGAKVCLPGEPNCMGCPVRVFCRTQGKHKAVGRKPRQVKREIAYALDHRMGSVLLVQRGVGEKLMPGMWELPQVTHTASEEVLFSLRHSITVTNYTVRVMSLRDGLKGTRVRVGRMKSLPLTGLTKKILRRAGIIQNGDHQKVASTKRGLR
jgi:A/G-specific adenine glycosylase